MAKLISAMKFSINEVICPLLGQLVHLACC